MIDHTISSRVRPFNLAELGQHFDDGLKRGNTLAGLAQQRQAREQEAQAQNTLAKLTRTHGGDLERVGQGMVQAGHLDRGIELQEKGLGLSSARKKAERETGADAFNVMEMKAKAKEMQRQYFAAIAPQIRLIADPAQRAAALRKQTLDMGWDASDIPDLISDVELDAQIQAAIAPDKRVDMVAETRKNQAAAEKEAWDRDYKERQLKHSAANTTKDNELASAKFELGKTKTEAEMARKAVDVNEVTAQSDESVALIDQMIGSEDGKVPRHPGFGGFVGAKGPSSLFGILDKPISGTDAAGFSALFDQVKGGAFLEAVQKMKGTGALSDTEGKAAAGAVTRMQASQNEQEFQRAASEFRTIIKNRKGRVIAKAAGTPGAASAPTSQVAQPKSKADRDALPPGARYIGPDGQEYVKR